MRSVCKTFVFDYNQRCKQFESDKIVAHLYMIFKVGYQITQVKLENKNGLSLYQRYILLSAYAKIEHS